MSKENNMDDFSEQIHRFIEHDKAAETLYCEFKKVFDISVTKAKNSITMTGGLRDLSEAARSLSSIRGDGINATAHAFNAKMKLAELQIKKDRINKDDSDADAAALLMRKLTETLQKQNEGGFKKSKNITNADIDFEDKSLELLNQRVNSEISSGKLRLNNNEKFMKYDFSGVSYRFDINNECMVVLDKDGNKIEDYPLERIPEEKRFKYIDSNGVPFNNSGREIELYEG